MSARIQGLEWELVPFKTGDEKQIIALMQGDLELRKSKAIFNERFWNWKYKENSAGYYPNWICLAESNVDGLNKEIVGHYTLIPVYLEIDRAKVLCSQSVDTLTQKEFRGRGIFTELAKECYQRAEESGIYLLYGYPNEDSYPGFVKKLGWSDIFAVEELVYILNPEKVSSIKFKNPILKQLGRLFLFFRFGYFNHAAERGPKRNYHIVQNYDFSDEHVQVAQTTRQSYRFFVDRSLEYLRWRYLENPIDKEVIIRSFSKSNGLSGFYVFKMKKYPHRGNLIVGHIMELMASPDNLDVMNYMLSDMVVIGRAKSIDILHVYTHGKQHDYDLLRSFGFMKFDKKHFIIRLCGKGLGQKAILEQGNWYLSLGDSDRA